MIAAATRRIALRTLFMSVPRRAIFTARPMIQTPMRRFSSEEKPSYMKEMVDPAKDWEAALQSETPVLIQAGASWCGPCVQLKPLLMSQV